MHRLWTLRLIEIVALGALVLEIWRILNTNNTRIDWLVDGIEFLGLLVIAVVCGLAEYHLRNSQPIK